MSIEILLGVTGLLVVVGVYFWIVRKPAEHEQNA
jgi:hypothetical protein